MDWQQNWSQPLGNFPMPTQNQMAPYNPMQYNPAMTPEQHYALQQNWQQWQTYQQQLAQWQAQYGEKYQQEMQQKFNQSTAMMPPIISPVASISSMQPINHLPPPPPNQPAPLPPPPPDSGIEQLQPTNNLNDPSIQRPFQPQLIAVSSASNTRNLNFLAQLNSQQQFSRSGSVNQNVIHPTGPQFGRTQFEIKSPNANIQQSSESVARPKPQITEDITDKTPEEKAFDEQFKKWEEEFSNWKLQNANHPDTRAYMEYEQKMEECRSKLLERREQMKRRKLELLQQQQQRDNAKSAESFYTASQQQQQQPLQQKNFAINQASDQQQQILNANQQITQQQSKQQANPVPLETQRIPIVGPTASISSSQPLFDLDNRVSDANVGTERIFASDISNNSKSELFIRGSVASSAIPGLDLVVDKPDDNEIDHDVIDTVILNDSLTKKEGNISKRSSNQRQQRPDFDALSRGINSILGDPNLASLLSNFQAPKPTNKPAIPSLLDMKMPNIDLNQVPRFNWQDDDDDDDDESIHEQLVNDSPNKSKSIENTQHNSNQLASNNCGDEQFDDDYDENMVHERFFERNFDDSNNSFQMANNRRDVDDFSNKMVIPRDNFNRNNVNLNNLSRDSSDNFNRNNLNMMNSQNRDSRDNFNRNNMNMMNNQNQCNNFGSSGQNFNPNFMSNTGPSDNLNQNRLNFMNDRVPIDFNQKRLNFNENMQGNNLFRGAANVGNLNLQNAMDFVANRMNLFDRPGIGIGNSSNFSSDRNQMPNDYQQGPNFGGGNRFGNQFNRPMMNDQFHSDQNNIRNKDRKNMNVFCRRRNYDEMNDDGFDTNLDSSNTQFPSNFRNNRFDEKNFSQQNSPQLTNVQNLLLATDSLTSDNAKDEDFFRPTKVIDYSASNKKPTQTSTDDTMLIPMKVVDYGHQTSGIVSRPSMNSRPRPVNKYTGDDFFPIKTIDYNHSSNKRMIKEYYYSIVSKWNSESSDSEESWQLSNKITEKFKNEPKVFAPPSNLKPKESTEITHDQLSQIDTSTKEGRTLKRALIMKRSTVNDYPLGHKFFPMVKWQLLDIENRKRPSLSKKRGKRKRKNGSVNPINKINKQINNEIIQTKNSEYEEILSNDEDSLEEYDMNKEDTEWKKSDEKPVYQSVTIPPVFKNVMVAHPIKQNVVLIEDLLYNPGRNSRPHKIVIIMRGCPGSGKTFLAKLIKEKEAENGGAAVRILSIDDYFTTEVDEFIYCPETGKKQNVKKMIYEYEKELEETYMQYLIKSYKKTIVDGLFDFIIVDSINATLRHYTEFYNFAKIYAFTPYTCELETNPNICFKRNIHQRTLNEIQKYSDRWSKTPEQYLKLDFHSFVKNASPFVVEKD